MNDNLCCLYPAYGAMVKALPRNAAQLDGMAEELLVQAVIPFFKQPQTKPVTAQQFNQWFNNLNGLEGLDDLDGFKKKLKKLSKRVVSAHKKVGKALTSKKLIKPFAYAVGAATGTIGLVAKADQLRNQQRKARAQAKAAQADSQEPIYQEPVQPVDFSQSFAPMSQSFMPSTPPDYSAMPQIPQAAPVMPTKPMFDPVTRLQQPTEQGRIVGVNGGAIMDSIKTNPVPWAIGAGVLVLLIAKK